MQVGGNEYLKPVTCPYICLYQAYVRAKIASFLR
jgi:hypothetical protein